MQPDRNDRRWSGLFEPAVSERRITVLLDGDVLAGTDDDANWSARTVLAGQLAHPLVDMLRYGDDGPPASAIEAHPYTELPYAPGWVRAVPADLDELVSHTLIWARDSDTTHVGGIVGNLVEHLARQTDTLTYADLPPKQAYARRAADAVAAGAAREVMADLLITDRPFLLAKGTNLLAGVSIVSPEQAVAMLGLYLRSRRAYPVWNYPGAQARFDKSLWFLVGARELLPSAWGFVAAASAASAAVGDQTLLLTAFAVIQRVIRALQSRDALWQAASSVQSADVREDALVALDSASMFLMGAADAAARVVHAAAALPGSDRNAGWQRRSWIKQLVLAEPAFDGLMAPESAAADTIAILTRLRNTVHGAGLSSVRLKHPGAHDMTLVALPSAEQALLLAAMDRRGGREAWGVRTNAAGQVHADPAPLLEALLPATLALLNDLMARTPTAALAPGGIAAQDTVPPAGDHQPFAPRFRDSIRWQLGLG